MKKTIAIMAVCLLAGMSLYAAKVYTNCGEVVTTIEAPPIENREAYEDYIEYVRVLNDIHCGNMGGNEVVIAANGEITVIH